MDPDRREPPKYRGEEGSPGFANIPALEAEIAAWPSLIDAVRSSH
jgi:hypothetical protein